MIQKDLQQLSTTPRDLRKFGLMVGGAFLVLGALLLFRRKPAWPFFLAPGAFLAVLGLVAPRTLKIIYIPWMALAFTLGLLVSTVILTLFYFLVMTPIALVGRSVGKDFLAKKLDPEAKSYWRARDRSKTPQPSDYEQQY